MGDSSRDRVLAALRAAAGPSSVEELAQSTRLHPNTVRTQLEVLQVQGAVQCQPDGVKRRGRPRQLFTVSSGPTPYQVLAGALATELIEIGDESAIVGAAERWAEFTTSGSSAESISDAVNEVVSELDELGFDPIASPLGDAIFLRACPYLELVKLNPSICDIHAALVNRLLEQTGQELRMSSLEIAPQPHTCVVRLSRPDLVPKRVIEPGLEEMEVS